MKIHRLKLLNFRTYERLDIIFGNYNIIYGNNGEGKTNLIESIYVLALTKSFRGSVDKVLIMNNKDFTKIEGEVEDIYTDSYKIIIKDNGKNVMINNNSIHKLSDYISKINVVLFNPDDLRIIKDTPNTRRKNLNLDISQINNSYLKNLNNYNKILKQRNMYLKSMYFNANKSNDYLDVLTNKLIDLGIKIYDARNRFIEMVNSNIKDIYKDITGVDGLNIVFKSDFSNLSKEELVAKYQDIKEKDIMFGKTNIGIHHDDIIFKLNDKVIKDYGSEGQQKNAVISYKFAVLNIFRELKGSYPIFILDDLFSELDKSKINNILNIINDDVQTFITTTEIDKVNKHIVDKSKLIEISNGIIREVSNCERRI